MTNYVTCDIDDNLGDQMFQIAITLQYAKHHNKTPIFFQESTSKKFSNYNVETLNINEKENFNFKQLKINHNDKVADLSKIEGNVELTGNFQSFNSIFDLKEKLQDIFFYNEDVMYKAYDLYQKIKNNIGSETDDNYVTVHVNKESYDETYYSKAYDIVSNLINSKGVYGTKHVAVVSNDIKWCRENVNFKNADKIYFVEEENEYIQMILMSFFAHNILSDSTLSWWGAFLSNQKEKTVTISSKYPSPISGANWIIV